MITVFLLQLDLLWTMVGDYIKANAADKMLSLGILAGIGLTAVIILMLVVRKSENEFLMKVKGFIVGLIDGVKTRVINS